MTPTAGQQGPAGRDSSLAGVLALETATTRCSVALLLWTRGEWRLAAQAAEDEARSQTRALFPLAERVLKDSGLEHENLAGLVVGVGPGTFTGVRIGVAAARAVALALGVPVIGRSALSALAARAALEAPAQVARLVPTLDARRGQVFAAVYERDEAESWQPVRPPFVADPGRLPQSVGVAGAGAGDTWIVGDSRVADVAWLPSAEFLVLGQDRLGQRGAAEDLFFGPPPRPDSPRPGEPGSPEVVRPLYVRAPDADQHIRKMKDPWA